MRAFARPLAAALGALLAATAVVGVGAAPAAATGKNPSCKELKLPSLFKQEGAVSGGNEFVSGTVSEDGKYLDVTPAAGVQIAAVIVKGGQNSYGQGHEVYYPPNSWQDLTAHVKNGKPQGISHWEVCGTKGETPPPPKPVDLKIKKKIEGDPVESAVTFTIKVHCALNGTPKVDETLQITVEPGESWAYGVIDDVPSGATCDISEPAATIPAGWELVDIFDEKVVIGQVSKTHDDYQKVMVVNKRTPEQPPTPTIDLSIVKADGDVVVEPGEAFTYTLTVTNNGPDKATGVVVEDVLPAEVEVVEPLPDGCTVEDDVVTCAIGALEVGGEPWVGEINVVAASDLTAEGECAFDNVAIVSGHEHDSDSTNNMSRVTTECEVPEQPPAPPTVNVSVHTPICDNDVPYLQYAVEATGTTDTTVDITWVNPNGDDVLMQNQPLTGRVLWPGAVVNADGTPADWPGWRLVNGEWVEGDSFDWVRPSVQVQFAVNPTRTVSVAYPPSSPSCDANPPVEDRYVGGMLPNTGSSGTTALAIASGVLIAAGGSLLYLRRRKLISES